MSFPRPESLPVPQFTQVAKANRADRPKSSEPRRDPPADLTGMVWASPAAAEWDVPAVKWMGYERAGRIAVTLGYLGMFEALMATEGVTAAGR